MRVLRSVFIAVLLAFSLVGIVGASSAAALPVWNIDIHHNPTSFPPGGTGEYWFDVENVGDTATSGTVTLTINLPGGVTRNSVRLEEKGGVGWNCPGAAGATTVTCTSSEPIPRHTLSSSLVLKVNVAAGAAGDRFTSATVKGGGALFQASTSELTHLSLLPAGFGVVDGSFKADFFAADGLTPVREAGAHPDRLTVSFDLNSIDTPTALRPDRKLPSQSLRDLQVDLPPGFVGNPTVVGECTPAELSFAKCPRSSQVGRVTATITPATANDFWTVNTGIYNMVHPRGTIADLAFQYAGVPLHIKASLDPANHYAVRTTVTDVNETLPPFHSKVTIWGVPASPSHDSERCGGDTIDTSQECGTDLAEKPFLTLPPLCGTDSRIKMSRYDSWESKGAFGPDIDYVLPGQFTGCDIPRFSPKVTVEPTGHQAGTPTGLDVRIEVPQTENPAARATPPVRKTVVTLPEGMSFSPSFADGLQACGLAQIGLGNDAPVTCPDASRIGEVELSTPLLPKPLQGSMYLAAQGDNPFDSLFALYLVLHDVEERGVLVKIPGRIDVDPVTGQVTTVFDDTPQLPFDALTLKFRSGSRAPLVNPPSCGTHTIAVSISSWARPAEAIDASNTYSVTEGANGAACPARSADRPFAPRLVAGTLNPLAGAYSPFMLRVTREDQEQELSQLSTTLPPGLVARIAGTPYCPEEALASISGTLGSGAAELGAPSCPAASRIGSISAGLGAGPGPNYFPGTVYLAGPYKGAPLSLAVVAPGLAGPFDLGNVLVRAALRVDPATARVTAVSDPFPTILHGVLLRMRDLRVTIDKQQTTINPTSCSRMGVQADIAGAGGSLSTTADDPVFAAAYPFQVGDCGALGFKPKLSLRLFGGTTRGAFPRLRAVLKARLGDANIARASVALPHSEFLAQGHIRTICTRVQFAADACPAGSVYGRASARTPLLDSPISGPVYLRANGGERELPDLVAVLDGQIEVELVGWIDSANEGIRNTFQVVPDAPVTSFVLEMQGGRKGLLQNSTNLCAKPNRATVKFTAHNGRVANLRPALVPSCKKGKRGGG